MFITINDKRYDISSSSNAPVHLLPAGAERRSKNKKDEYYVGDFGTFDIETTSCIISRDKRGRFDDGYGFMYIWQFYSRSTGLVMGRYWEEFIKLLRRIDEHYGDGPRFVIYVHNLSFEFTWLSSILTGAGIQYEVFATQSHKPLVVRCINIPLEIRCSYRLTNRGLAKYLKDMAAAGFDKMVGDLNYRIQRTPKTILSEEELRYCAVDVVGLHAALSLDMRMSGDTVASIPLTSTGYVRREYKAVIKGDKWYSYMTTTSAATARQFKMIRAMAKGGDTLGAASQEYGHVFKGVGSDDFVSSYPAQLLIEKFPQGKLEYEGRGEDIDISVLDSIERDGRFWITQFQAKNVEVKDKLCPIPCLTDYKCYYTSYPDGEGEDPLIYNGRILKADVVGVAMDMISFKLFRRQYKFDSIEFGTTYSCEYDYLPQVTRDFIMGYFRKKCIIKDELEEMEAKGLEKTEEYISKKMDYQLIKNMLNGIFGMFYTMPIFEDTPYDSQGCTWPESWPIAFDYSDMERYYPDLPEPCKQKLLKLWGQRLYVGQVSAIGPYLWGVVCTAWGRYKLDLLIRAAGYDNVIYSDTDSIKYIICDESRRGIARLNKVLKKRAMDRGAFYDTGKHLYVLGTCDEDGLYDEFVTLGAKKYCYRDHKDGQLHIVVSGIQKDQAVQLKDDIRNFHNDFIFDPAGGIMLHYIEEPLHTVHVVGDDGTEDDIVQGNNICCEDRIITLGGIRDERGGLEAYADLILGGIEDDDIGDLG